MDEFRYILEYIEKFYDIYSVNGFVVIFGDFNVYLLYGYGDKNLVNLNECGGVLE